MENTEFKAKFDNIQRLFDCCINHAYETLERSIYMKSQYLNMEQVEELEGQEYIRTAIAIVAHLVCRQRIRS